MTIVHSYRDGQQFHVVETPVGEVVQRESHEPRGNPLGTILLGLGIGIGGYAIGKNHGYDDGYDQAKTEDAQLIAQYQAQLQNMRRDGVQLQAENNRLLQENSSLCKENDILKGLLRQQPTTPESEAILNTLGRVEFRLTELAKYRGQIKEG